MKKEELIWKLIIVLVGLSAVGLILSAIGLAFMIISNYTGFNLATDSATLCNNYLTIKFQTSNQVRLALAFIAMCFNLAFIIALFSISLIMFIQNLNTRKLARNIVTLHRKVVAVYVLTSCALLTCIITFGYFLSLVGERGKCTGIIQSDWITISIIIGILLFILLCSYVIVCIIANSYPKVDHFKQSPTMQHTKEGLGQNTQNQQQFQRQLQTNYQMGQNMDQDEDEEDIYNLERYGGYAGQKKQLQVDKPPPNQNQLDNLDITQIVPVEKKKVKIHKTYAPPNPNKKKKTEKKSLFGADADPLKKTILKKDIEEAERRRKRMDQSGTQQDRLEAIKHEIAIKNQIALRQSKKPSRMPLLSQSSVVNGQEYPIKGRNFKRDDESKKISKIQDQSKHMNESKPEISSIFNVNTSMNESQILPKSKKIQQNNSPAFEMSRNIEELKTQLNPMSKIPQTIISKEDALRFYRKKPEIAFNKSKSRRKLFEQQVLFLQQHNHDSILSGVNDGNIPKQIDYERHEDKNQIRKKLKQSAVNSPRKIKKEKLAEWSLIQYIRSKYLVPDGQKLID